MNITEEDSMDPQENELIITPDGERTLQAFET
ncbi:hypothetical protein GWI33_002385, partial [Rhynchophorus ferrugineus]